MINMNPGCPQFSKIQENVVKFIPSLERKKN